MSLEANLQLFQLLQDICWNCIKVKCWFYTRKAAAETMKKLIQLFKHQDMQLNEIVEHYNASYLRLYSRKGQLLYTLYTLTRLKYKYLYFQRVLYYTL